MNAWISNKTNSKISHLIDTTDLDASLGLVLLNVAYFKAKWSHVFEEGLTKYDADFFTNSDVVKCDMMELRRQNFKLFLHPMGIRASVLEIPYDHFTLSCTIVLPDSDIHLDEVIARIDEPNVLNALLRSNHEANTLVNIHLPKFKFESRFDVS